jgi:anti-anti-sigma factor
VTPYELARRESGDSSRVVVDLMGELDLTNAREFEERLEELVDGEASLVLDVNRVVFIDSAALHVLFRTARRLGKDRFGIVFEPTAAIARTLAIVGMPEVATVGEATEELAAD